MQSVGTWWLWFGFFIFVLMVLAVDLFVLGGRKSHRVSTREALAWVSVWAICAVVFGLMLRWYLLQTQGIAVADEKSLEFFTGYLIEESLSFDNMFVILMVFNFFAVPAEHQRRVLLYGVLGAIVMRLLMIMGGAWLVHQFHWILYVFGAFLVLTGVRMLLMSESKKDLAQNPLLRWLRRHLRLTDDFHDEKFFVRQNRLWFATPLFLVLIFVEASDLIFALDSIPAIFAITTDPFIVFTSNIFAIMGLRAIYFLLAAMAARFSLLKYGIALVILFVGVKMLIEPWLDISVLLSLGVVMSVLVTTVALSLLRRK